jgi:RecA-family ATPase
MLTICHASCLEPQPVERRWLVEELWADQAVGIIGGEPKSCKSFMALSLGVAVASGRPCLGRFAVPTPGKVLLYPAEDALSTVRRRLAGICAVQGVEFERLPLWVITAPRFRLDIEADRRALDETIEELRPRLLILDPFVRLHSVDENASGEVAELLRHLRQLQRAYGVAVALVHHFKKGAAQKRPGQALRGSSEFHAWSDSNLYLARPEGDSEVRLAVEHRAERSREPVTLRLVSEGDVAHLEIARLDEPPQVPTPSSAEQRILELFAASSRPLRIRTLRQLAGLRHETITLAAQALIRRGVLELTDHGYRLVEFQAD